MAEDEIVAAAHDEARRMIDSVAAAAPDAEVMMKVAQFRKLAHLIDGLAASATRQAIDCATTPHGGGFDAPIDGVRFWVPIHHLAAERARFAQMLAAQPTTHALDRFAF